MDLAFIGLGVWGPMAGICQGRALGHGRITAAYPAPMLVAGNGGTAKPIPARLRRRDIVFACLGNDDDLRQVRSAPDGALPV